jgi:uncharacterized membrane protein YfcA
MSGARTVRRTPPVTGLEALGVLAAGIGAGTINTVVGSGTLITFPVLLAIGLPPVTANVSNTVGLVPGSLSGAVGYRRELAGQRTRLLQLGSCSLIGGIVGAVLLLTLPPGAFKAIVPVLIAIALLLVIAQPWLAARLAATRPHTASNQVGSALAIGVLIAGIYGGYFGAAQGVLLLGLMGLLLQDDLQRINATKNVLALIVNGVAAVVFIAVAHVDWAAAGLIAAGSIVGGQIGALVGRRLPPLVFRAVIVVIGAIAIVQLV